jgi:hypothetical protein
MTTVKVYNVEQKEKKENEGGCVKQRVTYVRLNYGNGNKYIVETSTKRMCLHGQKGGGGRGGDGGISEETVGSRFTGGASYQHFQVESVYAPNQRHVKGPFVRDRNEGDFKTNKSIPSNG